MAAELVVVGAGGHGRVVAEIAAITGWRVLGFVDRDRSLIGLDVGGLGYVIGTHEELFSDDISLPEDWRAVVGIGDNTARAQLTRSLLERLAEPLIHPSAIISTSATVEQGVVVGARAVINVGAHIERAVIINTGAIVEHDCLVEYGGHISSGAVLCGGAVVRARAWVGAGAVVLPGIELGQDATLGAGSVLTHHAATRSVLVGCPARPLHS